MKDSKKRSEILYDNLDAKNVKKDKVKKYSYKVYLPIIFLSMVIGFFSSYPVDKLLKSIFHYFDSSYILKNEVNDER